ncbi:MAG: hypothetical protein V4706_02850 [Pseudomonadota bacterium]
MIWLGIAVAAWLTFALIGIPTLYIGYGFAMAAKRARDDKENPSQAVVVKVDGLIVFPFIVLDVLLNIFVVSVLMLDFRRKHTLNMVTGRFCLYSADPGERAFRRWTTVLLAAFLNGKEKDHIAGVVQRFSWLD